MRVAVDATGVSFAEQQMLRGKYYDQPPFPFVPGFDPVGMVTAVGPDGDESMVGRRYAAVTKVVPGPATWCSTPTTWSRSRAGSTRRRPRRC